MHAAVVAGLVGQRPPDDGGDLDEVRLVGICLARSDHVVELCHLLFVGGEAVGEGRRGRCPSRRRRSGPARLLRRRSWCRPRSRCGCRRRSETGCPVRAWRPSNWASPDTPLHAAVAGDAEHAVAENRLRRARPAGRTARASVGRSSRSRPSWPRRRAERPGGAPTPLVRPKLGVAGGERPPGAQAFDVVQFEPEPVQVELRVLGHRRVPGRHHEPVAAQPAGFVGVDIHHLGVEQVGRSGASEIAVPGWPLPTFDRIGGQDAGGVDRLRILL